MSLDLRLIESFVAVAETLSFSTAAARLNTVQSAISTHIKQLEAQVNQPLVTRGRGQPVTLTDEGVAFLVQARRVLMLADQMMQHPAGAVGGDPIRLGTTITFALSLVPGALSDFASRGARAVTVRTARSHALMDLLEAGEIDVALVFDQGAHPMQRITVDTDLAWVAAETFVQPVDTPLPLAFLDDARDLRRHAFAALDTERDIETSLSTHPDPIGLRAVVSAGVCITILPRIAIASPLCDVTGRLGLPQLRTLPISIYARPNPDDPGLGRLVRILQSALRG